MIVRAKVHGGGGGGLPLTQNPDDPTRWEADGSLGIEIVSSARIRLDVYERGDWVLRVWEGNGRPAVLARSDHYLPQLGSMMVGSTLEATE